MAFSFSRALSILLLCVYVPVSIAICALHSDDVPAVGDGHHAVRTLQLHRAGRCSGHGVCLACQFAAGHIVVAQDQVPVLAPELDVWLAPPVVPAVSLLPAESVRGPPSSFSQ